MLFFNSPLVLPLQHETPVTILFHEKGNYFQPINQHLITFLEKYNIF